MSLPKPSHRSMRSHSQLRSILLSLPHPAGVEVGQSSTNLMAAHYGSSISCESGGQAPLKVFTW